MTQLKLRVRDDFLISYSQLLRRYLNDFAEGSGLLHIPTISVSDDIASVALAFVKEEDADNPWQVVLTRVESIAPQSGWLVFGEHSATIQKPCQDWQHLSDWSNVQAYLDAGEIIAQILSARA